MKTQGIAPLFQKAGKLTTGRIRKTGRAEGMVKMREELRKMKNQRLKHTKRLMRVEKKLVLAKVIKTAVLAIFKTHTYSFGSKFYLQAKGGPIGLRSTCCVARLVIMWWDDKLLEAVEKAWIKRISGGTWTTSGSEVTGSDLAGGW